MGIGDDIVLVVGMAVSLGVGKDLDDKMVLERAVVELCVQNSCVEHGGGFHNCSTVLS